MVMKSLELRIPPPVVLLLVGIAMWGVAYALPPASKPPIRVVLAVLLAIAGIGVGVAGAMAFRKAKTTTNPTQPQQASTLVVSGVYQYTRNPMYLGLCLILVGWATGLWCAWTVFGPVAFVLYIRRFQITPEERALMALFGGEYSAYMARVRQWF